MLQSPTKRPTKELSYEEKDGQHVAVPMQRLGHAQALHLGLNALKVERGDRRDFGRAFLEEAPFDPPIVSLVLRVVRVRVAYGLRRGDEE